MAASLSCTGFNFSPGPAKKEANMSLCDILCSGRWWGSLVSQVQPITMNRMNFNNLTAAGSTIEHSIMLHVQVVSSIVLLSMSTMHVYNVMTL